MTPPDTAARAELAQAIAALGHHLPAGMQVLIYRPEEAQGDQRVAVEATFSDGSVDRHWLTELVSH